MAWHLANSLLNVIGVSQWQTSESGSDCTYVRCLKDDGSMVPATFCTVSVAYTAPKKKKNTGVLARTFLDVFFIQYIVYIVHPILELLKEKRHEPTTMEPYERSTCSRNYTSLSDDASTPLLGAGSNFLRVATWQAGAPPAGWLARG